MHPIAQIGMFIAGFALAGMLVAELFLSIFVALFPVDDTLKQTLLLLFTYLCMLGGLAAIVLSTRRNIFFSKYKRGLDYIYGIGYALTIVIVSMIVGAIISIFHTPADNNNQAAAVAVAKNYPIIAFFLLGFLGPICEELTYRVGLYSFFRRINKYLAFGVTIVVFALIHFDFRASDIINELWSLPSYLISGFILTLAYEHRGPACSMTAHVLYNIFAFLIMLAA
jgi:membrane protease YdiL (CAAX protease family)